MSDSQKPPQRTAGDTAHAIVKGTLSSIPYAGGLATELFELVLASPLSKRRNEWMQSIAERLKAVEVNLDSLRDDPAFTTTMLEASQIALRTHQEEKLEALRNAVLNTALGKAPEEDLRAIFLNFVAEFTPTHLFLLKYFENRNAADSSSVERLVSSRTARSASDQFVNDLLQRGLIEDTRPYAARGRPTDEALFRLTWNVTNLGKLFLNFIFGSKP